MTPEQRLKELNITLPEVPEPKAVYKPCLIDGRHLYVSGHVPMRADFTRIRGKVGADMDVEEAKQMARLVGMLILSSIRKHVGSLDKVKRVIKVLGFVNGVPDFDKHPIVINGCSELFAEIWGPENGIGVRSAVGMGSLPDGIPVEVEALFELFEPLS
ncbi:MAG: RidA family protein [Sphingobacteriales bacterium]|jgi:enamine deaminase RidA (YjgF/YER057c/UK114 family)